MGRGGRQVSPQGPWQVRRAWWAGLCPAHFALISAMFIFFRRAASRLKMSRIVETPQRPRENITVFPGDPLWHLVRLGLAKAAAWARTWAPVGLAGMFSRESILCVVPTLVAGKDLPLDLIGADLE